MTHVPQSAGTTSAGRSWHRRYRVPLAAAAALVAAGTVFAAMPSASAAVSFPVESLNGNGNNVNNPTFGQAGNNYSRVGTAHYADGIGTMDGGNAPRTRPTASSATSTRTCSPSAGSRSGRGRGASSSTTPSACARTRQRRDRGQHPVQASDPLEEFTSNLGVIPFNRSAAAPGTGTSTSNPRQQVNTLASYINGNPVYGAHQRPAGLAARRFPGRQPDQQRRHDDAARRLPAAPDRPRQRGRRPGDGDGRPAAANPGNAVAAGDKRANENIALTATHTLFAREHNRIVGLLPNTLSQEDKFQIARRVVIAEQQYITYQEFLPAMGVALPRTPATRTTSTPT